MMCLLINLVVKSELFNSPISIKEQVAPVSIIAFISLPSNFNVKTAVKFSSNFRVVSFQGPYSH